MDIEKLEALTEARKKAWTRFHEAIGADNAATAFAKQCNEAMRKACRESEDADNALFNFVRQQTEASNQ